MCKRRRARENQMKSEAILSNSNFIFKNYGKHAFSLVDRKRKKAIRVCLRPDAFEADPKYLSLSEKVQSDEVSPKELAQFRKLQQARVQKVLEADVESIFKIEEIILDIPSKARIMESGTCDFCGEPTKIDRLRESNGKKLCIPCAHRTQPSA